MRPTAHTFAISEAARKLRRSNSHTKRDKDESQYFENQPKFQKYLRNEDQPIPVSGANLVPMERTVVWKNVCKLGNDGRECIVEMSYTKTKFYIVALDMQIEKYHVVELFRNQANKLIKSLTNASYEELLQNKSVETANVLYKLMTFLEFKYGKLRIKDQELLMQYQLFMTPEMI